MNLLETLKQQFAGDALSQVNNLLGESEAQTKTALASLVPSMLASVLGTASSSTGSQKIVDLIRGEEQKGSLTGSLTNMISEGTIRNLLTQDSPLVATLFGSKAGFIIDAVTRLSGIKRESASSLIRIVAPLIIGTIGRWLKGQGDERSALISLASTQLPAIKALVPPSLLADLGLPDIAGKVAATKTAVRNVVSDDFTERSPNWAPFLLLPILAFAAYWMFSGGTKDQTVEIRRVNDQAKAAVQGAIDSAAIAVREGKDQMARASADIEKMAENLQSLKLPGNVELKVAPGSFTERFVSAVTAPKTASGGILHDTTGTVKPSLIFDKVNFATNAATLTPDSRTQLDELASVLKAYPPAKIKIIGYTDNVGDAEKNKALSAARAETVKGYLTSMAGIAATRIATEGRGAQKPIADNSTEQGQAKNRRIEVEIVNR